MKKSWFYHHKMPDANKNILESKLGKKSLKHAFVIYEDLECLLLKMNACNNNPNNSYTIAKALHKPSRYYLLTSDKSDKTVHLINQKISKLIIEE